MADIIRAGTFGGAYGVKGWLKLMSYTSPKENILSIEPWWIKIGDTWQLVNIEAAKTQGKTIIAKIKGVENPEHAREYTNVAIGIAATSLPQLPAGEYYWRDLMGLEVYNLQGEFFGTVTNLLETGANDVLEVTGKRQRLIPYIEEVISKVDLTQQRIAVDWDADF